MKTCREVTWGEPWKNCLNDEGKDLMGQKVVTTGLLWLSLGLNMDSMYARSYLTDSLLHEGGKVNWGPLATDCIELGLVFKRVALFSSLSAPTQAWERGRFRPSNPRLSSHFSKGSSRFQWCQRTECDPSLPVWQPHLANPVCLRHTVPREDN